MSSFSIKRAARYLPRVRHRLVRIGVVVLMFGLGAAANAAPPMFRWVDENGVVQYGDQIPPTQVEKGHAELNAKGIRVETVAPAQTIEELRREKELERQRRDQARLIEQQKAADRVLLRTFRSVDDLLMARDGKVAAIDVVIQVARGNIRRQQDWLRNLRTEAANLERAGKPVPQHLTDSIGKTERNIRDAYATIVDREQEKEGVREDFDRDLKRFRQLKEVPEDKTGAPEESPRPTLRNLVICGDEAQCDQDWARAVAYVKAHATTAIQTSGPNIVITAPPETREDLSLTLSRTQEKDGSTTSIFLDLQCKNKTVGDTNCSDARAVKVLNEFRDAVMGTSPPEAEAAIPATPVVPTPAAPASETPTPAASSPAEPSPAEPSPAVPSPATAAH